MEPTLSHPQARQHLQQSELFQCSACLKSFTTRGKYNQHLKTHTKPYRCSQCTKGFALRLDLNRHVQARHRLGLPKFPCAIDSCGFKASRKDNLCQHQRTIHNNRTATSTHLGTSDIQSTESLLPSKEASSASAQVPSILSLFDAASHGNISLLENLLRSGIKLSSKAHDGSTALHCAARVGHAEVVRYLLRAGAQIKVFNNKGRAPIHEATLSEDWETMKALLQAGADMNTNDERNKSAIGYVAETGNVDLVDCIIQYCGREIVANGPRTMLHHAARAGQGALLRFLLSYPEVDVNSKTRSGRTPIRYAIEQGHTEVVRQLAAHPNIDLNPKGLAFSPLECAVHFGREDIVKLLTTYSAVQFEHGASYPEQEVRSALQKGHVSVARTLIEGIRVQRFEDSTPLESGLKLLLSVLKGSITDFVELHRSCSLSSLNPSFAGFAPLNWAIALGQTEMIEILLADHRTNINAVYETFAPLDLAVKTNNHEVLRMILEHAQLDIEKAASIGLLHRTIVEDNYKMLSLLLKRLDVNRTAWMLGTPLHAAVKHGNIQVVKMLLECKNIETDKDCFFRIFGRSMQYVSPLEVARRNNHTEIVKLLLAHGAKDNAPLQPIEPSTSTTMQEAAVISDVESNDSQTSSDEMEEDMDDLVDWGARPAA